jgi:hypothetical protein
MSASCRLEGSKDVCSRSSAAAWGKQMQVESIYTCQQLQVGRKLASCNTFTAACAAGSKQAQGKEIADTSCGMLRSSHEMDM